MRRLVIAVIMGMLLTACSRPSPQPPPEQKAPESKPVSVPVTRQKEYQPGEKHQYALKLIGDQDYPRAEVALQQVVAAEPQAAEAWSDLSLVQIKLGRFREAAASAKRALDLKPGFSFAEYNLGLALLQTSDEWQEAKPHLEASAGAQPDRPEPLYALGLWYKYAGDLAHAQAAFEKGSKMGYGPAAGALVMLEHDVSQSTAMAEVVARFPDAPVQVIWDLMQGYVQQGYTRRIERVIPVRLRQTGETSWAALLREESSTDHRTSLQFQVPEHPDDYQGSCAVPGFGPVDLAVQDYGGGQHVLVRTDRGTLVCGLKDNFVGVLFSTSADATVTAGGLEVGGTIHRYVPEISQYVSASAADQAETLLGAIRKAGYKVAQGGAVFANLDLGQHGGPGQALAWEGGVAFHPQSGPVSIYGFGDDPQHAILYPYPTAIGKVAVPNHVFLAVQTHQPGGPNGADVVVLEFDTTTGRLHPVFSGGSDGAGFGGDYVFTAFKHYLPQGGFETYVTDYTWDEQKHTFVPGKTVKSDK